MLSPITGSDRWCDMDRPHVDLKEMLDDVNEWSDNLRLGMPNGIKVNRGVIRGIREGDSEL